MPSGPVNTTISNSTSTGLTVGGDDTVTVTSTGKLSTSKKQDITWDQSTLQNAGGVVISNSGSIIATAGRAIDTTGTATGKSSFTLDNNAAGTIVAYGNVMRDQTGNDGGFIVINNAGLMESQTDRAFNFQQDVPVVSGGNTITSFSLLSLNNSGIILSDDDTFRVTNQTPGASGISAFYNPVFTGTINISNTGTIESIGTLAEGGPTGAGSGQALDLDDVNAGAGGSVLITNGSATNTSALFFATDNDAVRPGDNGTVVNYGTIDGAQVEGSMDPDVQASSNGIAAGVNDTVTVMNMSSGLIEGAKSGVFGSRDDTATSAPSISSNILVTNAGTIIGEDGKGVGADYGSVDNSGTIDGTISSNFARGDGDGVDINFTGFITNTSTGLIEALGAKGVDDNGRRNISDAISIGGGTVDNAGTIFSVGNGVTVNDDSNPDGSRSGNADLVLVNTGLIEADGGYAIRSENKTGTDETGGISNVDYDTVSNYGTIISNGTIPDLSGTFYVESFTTSTSGGVTTYGTVLTPDPNVVGTIEGQTYTSAADAGSIRFTEGDGSAIQLGEGNDILNEYGTIIAADGRAVNLEGGNNTLNLFTGADIVGTIDGGLGGTNVLDLNVPSASTAFGTLDGVIDFASLNVLGGVWTVEDDETYADVSIAAGAELDDGKTLAITGSFVNAGRLQVNGGAELDYSATSSAQSSGGTVAVYGLFNAQNATLDVGPDTAFSTLINFGTIESATIINDGGVIIPGGLLKADTWEGELQIGGENYVAVQGGLTALGAGGTGPGNIVIDGADSTLAFNDTETFNNAGITLGSADGLANLEANGTLTLGAGVTVQSAADSFVDTLGGNGSLINEGTINATNGDFYIQPANLTNAGDIDLTGGIMGISSSFFFGTVDNAGEITDGSTMSINAGTFINTGSIQVNGGAELDYFASHTATQASGGTLAVYGLFNAQTSTLDVGPDTAFSTLINFGTIESATIINDGGVIIPGGLLKADTWEGELQIGGENYVAVQGGLTALGAGGTGPGNIVIDGADSTLAFNDTETFNNAGITLGSAGGLANLEANGTLTLGAGVTVQSAADSFVDTLGGNGSLINDGTINATNGDFYIQPANFTNAGDIDVTGGSFTIEPAFGFFGTFNNTGDITIGTAASFFAESKEIDNSGTILVDGVSSIFTNNWGTDTTHGTFEIGTSGTATFEALVAANQDISFLGDTGLMNLLTPSSFLGTVTSFNAGDKIDLSGLADDTSSFANYVLTVSHDGSIDATLTFGSEVDGTDLGLVADGNGGVYVELVTCFCEGTNILTARGEVPVQELTTGDLVLTASGSQLPIMWLGSWEVDLDANLAADRVRPVRISAGALDGELPRRDLYVSPDHSLLLNGVLVPAALLLNGETITQPNRKGTVVYYHVQIEPHDVLLAEGAAAESYLDRGTTLFRKSDEEPRSWEDACAPIVLAGPQLHGIRAQLEAVAGALGSAAAA